MIGIGNRNICVEGEYHLQKADLSNYFVKTYFFLVSQLQPYILGRGFPLSDSSKQKYKDFFKKQTFTEQGR